MNAFQKKLFLGWILFLTGNPNIWADSTNSSRVRTQNYSYYQDISIESKSKTSAQYGSLELSPEVIRNSYYSDLRLMFGNTQVPFQRTVSYKSLGKQGFVIPKLLLDGSNEKKHYYVFEIPPIPENSQLSKLEIQSNSYFETNWSALLGDQLGEWDSEQQGFLYSYSADSSLFEEETQTSLPRKNKGTFISLKTKHRRFLRIETINIGKIQFPKYYYEPTNSASSLTLELEPTDPKNLSDLDAIQYEFPNTSRFPFDEIQLSFLEEDYYRSFEIKALNPNQNYISLMKGNLFKNGKNSDAKQTITLPSTVNSSWKLILFHVNNPPLHLKHIAVLHPKEALIFRLPEGFASDKDSLRLYYGYHYAEPPDYDTTGFPDREDPSFSYAIFKTSEQVENPDKSYSFFQPPVSIWVARFVYLLGLLGISYLSFGVFRQWKADSTPQEN